MCRRKSPSAGKCYNSAFYWSTECLLWWRKHPEGRQDESGRSGGCIASACGVRASMGRASSRLGVCLGEGGTYGTAEGVTVSASWLFIWRGK